jgi:hypothetical protein
MLSATDVALRKLGLYAKQRRDALAATPDLTPDDVARWQAFKDNPPAWCNDPIRFVAKALVNGDPLPEDRQSPPIPVDEHGNVHPSYYVSRQ